MVGSSNNDLGLGVALLVPLILYVAGGTALGASLYWMMQPRVYENTGMAAYRPPQAVATIVAYQRPKDWTPPKVADSEVESATASLPPLNPVAKTMEEPARTKPAAKKATRKLPAERWAERTSDNAPWERASHGFGFRPWF
jgi:hypothetical protein